MPEKMHDVLFSTFTFTVRLVHPEMDVCYFYVADPCIQTYYSYYFEQYASLDKLIPTEGWPNCTVNDSVNCLF